MPDRPLLIFPQPATVTKTPKFGGPTKFSIPSPREQERRLRPKVAKLRRDFQARRAELRSDATGIEPEFVLVLEIVGSIEGFFRTVQRTSGLEWLGEWETEIR